MNKGVLIYSILTLGIVLLINQYVSTSLMYKSKVNSIERHYRNLEKIRKNNKEIVLVIGNSYVNASMLDGIREDVYKLIIHGMPMEDMVSIMQTLPQELKIKKMLIGLGYNYAMPIISYSYVYKKYAANNIVDKIWWSIPLVRGNSLISSIVREDIKCVLSEMEGSICRKARIEQQLDDVETNKEKDIHRDYRPHERMQKSVKHRYRQFLPYTAIVSEAFIENLNNIKLITSQRDIELYAYTAPIYEKLRSKLHQDVLWRFRESLDKNGINYVDLNLVYPNWDHSYFGDATHVNEKTGGKETTNYLLEFMGEKISG